MHLHAWNSPPTEPLTADDWRHKPYLIEYSDAMMREKVDYMTRLLEDTFQTKMVSHRAGRWAFDERYARLLVEYGYQVDCSVTPRVNWKTAKGAPQGDGRDDYRRFPQHAYFLDENDISREGHSPLLEVPDEHPVQALSVDEQREAGLRPPARQSAFPLRTLAATDGRQCGDDEKSRRTNVDARAMTTWNICSTLQSICPAAAPRSRMNGILSVYTLTSKPFLAGWRRR